MNNMLSKIRKLLALADHDRNPNEHERETALRQANALMEKYQISELDLGNDDDSAGPRGRSALHTGSARWKSRVVAALGELYGARVYFTSGAAGATFIVGREQHREVVASMARYVWDSISRESARLPITDRSYRNAWRKGAASGVRDTVRTLLAERTATEQHNQTRTPGTALVLTSYFAAERELNSQWLAAQGVRLSSSRSTHSNPTGFSAGQRYGRTVSLRGQVSGSTPKRIR